MEACTLNTQRKKLWHIIAKEEGFFNVHRRTIKKKLWARDLRRAKSTKKLGLMDTIYYGGVSLFLVFLIRVRDQ